MKEPFAWVGSFCFLIPRSNLMAIHFIAKEIAHSMAFCMCPHTLYSSVLHANKTLRQNQMLNHGTWSKATVFNVSTYCTTVGNRKTGQEPVVGAVCDRKYQPSIRGKLNQGQPSALQTALQNWCCARVQSHWCFTGMNFRKAFYKAKAC